jgi:DNA primase
VVAACRPGGPRRCGRNRPRPGRREQATPFLQFRLDRLFASSDLTTAEGRGRAGQAAAAIVSQHPNELVRDQYVMKLAARLSIEADALRQAVAQAVARPAPCRRARRSGGWYDDAPPERTRRDARRRSTGRLTGDPRANGGRLDRGVAVRDPQAVRSKAIVDTFHGTLEASEGPSAIC